ncbi:ABC transporter permease [Amycolatopsis sp. DSM 110486]|uniref:ABC transporter permease n=1 Tax=Amycolatopsis sp. DSM 110486 TaxID=2865832 RepID=UPI001C6A255E|nr:ABC transporter permease [Amycolatopsis sp. DSM 110486]QYN22643.1 ABC transporter permease [Amycolatopsis sp. DSM 110486]
MTRAQPIPVVRLAPGDLLRLGLVGLRTRPGRAVLSALGIAIGIATMILVTAIPASSEQALLEQLTRLGTNILQVTPVVSDPPVKLRPESVAMAQRIGPVTVASAVANTNTPVGRNDLDDDYSGLTVLAAKPNLPEAINAHVGSGQFLNAANERFPTVVLGSVAASRLGFTRVDAARPQQVYVGRSWFTVVGILDKTPLSPDIDRSVLVGWAAAQAELHFDGSPTVIYVKADEAQVEAVRKVLPATVDPELPGLVQVSLPSDGLLAKRATQATLSTLFLGLAGVALLVGGIGVANTMVISVLERRREIGLRRALGANRGQIRVQFLTEAVTLSAIGGLAGVAVGALATLAYATYQRWPVVIPPAAVVGALVGAVVIGVVAGVYPSVRAARLTPTAALATT